jgi:hypothetical protein
MPCRCHYCIQERAIRDYLENPPVIHEATEETYEFFGIGRPIVGGDKSHELEVIQADGGEVSINPLEQIKDG